MTVMVALLVSGCAAGMNANSQTFATHLDPSISLERTRAYGQQPWGYSFSSRSSLRIALRALFDVESSAAYWRRAIAAAERIPEAKPVKESVPADVLDRLDRQQVAQGR